MTVTTASSPVTATASSPLVCPRRPRLAPAGAGVIAASAAGLVALTLGAGLIAWAIVAVLLFSAVLPVWALVVEGRRAAADRLATSLVWTAFLVALVPLVPLLWTVLVKEIGRAQVRTPVTNAHLVCRLLLDIKQIT